LSIISAKFTGYAGHLDKEKRQTVKTIIRGNVLSSRATHLLFIPERRTKRIAFTMISKAKVPPKCSIFINGNDVQHVKFFSYPGSFVTSDDKK